MAGSSEPQSLRAAAWKIAHWVIQFVTLPGVPAVLASWAISGYAVIEGVPNEAKFALVALDLWVIFLAALVFLPDVWRERRVSVGLVPQAGAGPDIRLHIRNKARSREHWARARIVAIRKGPDPRQGTYAMQWLNHTGQRVLIQRDDSEPLLVAQWRSDPGVALGEIAGYIHLIEMSASTMGDRQVWTYLRWFTDDEELPEIDLEISVYAAGVSKPHVERFTLVLPSVWGPWTMATQDVR